MSRLWRTWVVLLFFTIGTSLITPLIPLYQERLGFGDTVVTLFLAFYVVGLVPSMLVLGQTSDRIGRRPVLLGALTTLAIAQLLLVLEPPLWGVLVARAIQGLSTGAFVGTCTAFLVDAAAPERRMFASALGSISVRLGLGLGPGIGGVLAQYAPQPLRLPFALHLVAIGAAAVLVVALPETVIAPSRRPLSLRLEVPQAERAVFWRVLVPSGMLFSLFDGVALSLIPVFLVREMGVSNYAVVGAAGFLVLVSGAASQVIWARLRAPMAIGVGLAWATIASVGVVLAAPMGSTELALVAVAATGAGAGLVFKGGIDLCTQIAPPADRGKLLSSYYVACYLGGFSVPLIIIGALGDLIGLTAALGCLSATAAIGGTWVVLFGLRSLSDLRPVGTGIRAG